MADPVATAEQLYAALDEDETAPFLDLCAVDVVVEYPSHASLTWAGRWEGRNGVRAFLDAHDAAEEILEFSVARFVADGEVVVAIGTFTARAKGTGREWTTPFVHLLTIRDERLHRWQAFFDTAAAVTAHA
ncbi:MAG: nuclear transport factor 2 family protein [Chloroflexota bacterium]|nr:nuclear transport factor 2 family protein [Chloroflexota bacterium]